jgi:hypothetical protein
MDNEKLKQVKVNPIRKVLNLEADLVCSYSD